MRRGGRLLVLISLALAGAFLVAAPRVALAQSIIERLITPGPLSQAHARLEANCNSCHSSFRKEAQNARCVACHQPVRQDIAGGGGFHGRFGPARSGACKSCHSEHKGRSAGLVQLNRATFNHALTDYPLTGRHAGLACTGCHRPGAKFRAAPRDCATCHARTDPHRGQLGRACQTCHTVAGWKPIQPFDHSSTGFTLSGAHRQVACLSCHAGQRWKGLPATCIACHARDDAHKGSRGTNCASCHQTSAWRAVTFDHSSTGFPLVGAHASAGCSGCHGAGNANRHPARACVACHRTDDVHKGANGTECQSCHSARGWKQVSFDHDRMTRFPLKGAHEQAACQACHKQPPRVAKPPVKCIGCHLADDRHQGSNGTDCGRCHSASGWKITSFSHDTMTRFPLRGKHAQATCQSCHVKPASEVKLALECVTCHGKDDVHSGRLGQKCETCHNASGWKAGVVFDHALTRFPLLGKHAALQCTSCHADRTFAAKGTACAACHVDDHHKGALGQPASCASCHNTVDWKAWSFDHDAATSFRLTGRHQGLICSACHVRAGDPGKLGTRCIDCHRRADPHHGGFGEDCERCHVTTSFREIIMSGR